MALDIFLFPCLSDNYGVLVHDPVSGRTASIDVPDAKAVLDALQAKGWRLTDIFTTHHHVDHVQGNLELKAATGAVITGPAREADKIPGIDRTVREGDVIDFAGHPVEIFETPGHTLGHIVYYFPQDEVAFVADTLFALGCGRVFEGTLEEMWRSVEKVGALPADTKLYVGHEYTESNWRFAMTVDPTNQALIARGEVIRQLRAESKPTVPTNVAIERATNPYLRAATAELRQSMNLPNGTPAEVFAAIRTAKDNFKG
ncbi:hydroxyacylglutathione hydrolase [Kaistia algarum]|uniref:hydroxyacylglutathione hydrolase n=1 Tax=Kaistia algarum TaxID=2083279 RepID=UPI000CE8FFB3|nr:hydroxyacylglutathione hydrolase [Kaistia algarum]MCX5514239.1 hydroxyacylglutathione hydrolase [Kaistia algarum]PPE77381.1 hydroxyacylglutathione hydrolase [Kaistia algarum]